jgi:hypothetical protein
MLEDAVAEYLADPYWDLPIDELLYKLMKGRVEQKPKCSCKRVEKTPT